MKEWRSQKAAKENVPRFQVLHQKTLVQIAVILPDSLQALSKIKGIGKFLLEKYGQELVALVSAYRLEHTITKVVLPESVRAETKTEKKIDTKQISLEMFERNVSIPQIAKERGLAVSTIEAHLAFFVETGELNIDSLVEVEKQQTIERKLTEVQGNSLREVKEALGDGCSYGEIRMVLAHLKYLEKKDETDD